MAISGGFGIPHTDKEIEAAERWNQFTVITIYIYKCCLTFLFSSNYLFYTHHLNFF